jgi:hypothetical protein
MFLEATKWESLLEDLVLQKYPRVLRLKEHQSNLLNGEMFSE